MTRPKDLPEFVITKGPSRAGGGGGGGGGGGRSGGGSRGGDGGNQWARGAAPPPQRRSSQQQDGGGGGGGSGGGQWARGQAPPKPQPNQQQGQRGKGGRRGQGPPYFDGPVAPLVKSDKGWRPQKNTSALVVAEKQVKSILNKMTKEKFGRLSKQMCEIPVVSHDMLTMMIHNVYEKAIDEPAFGDMYGDLCVMLSQHVQGNSYVKIIESDEEPPTEDGAEAAQSSAGQSSSHIVYRWSNDVSTSDSEIVGPFSTDDECVAAALDGEKEQSPIERGEMELELHKLMIKNGVFIKVMKKKGVEEGEENGFYTVFFPVADHKECGQQLSAIFLSERECVSDATKQNSFKRSLLNKCEDEFNKQDIYVDWKKEKAAYEESKKQLTEGERNEKEEELDFRRMKIKKQMLGNIKFIGQLYKKNLLKEKIMRYCIASLLKLEPKKDDKSKNPGYYDTGDEDMDAEDHEAICSMFATIGSTIDRSPAADFMSVCFTKIKRLSTDTKLPSRSRFMYKDLIELRGNNWVPRRKEEKAKTLEEIRKDVEKEERLQAQQSQQGGGNYRGGGGGRGDRNDYSARGGGRGREDRGDYRSRQSYSGGNNRSRQSKPSTQTDDDGFTVIGGGGGSGKSKSSLAQALTQQPSKQQGGAKKSFAALADDSSKPSNAPAPLDKDKFERRVKSMRGEFVQDPKNTEELLLSMDEISGTPNAGQQFVSLNADRMMDCKDEERKAIFSMVAILFEKRKITSSDVKNGLMDAIEFIDSFVYDAPKAYEYLGEMLYNVLRVGAADMPWLCDQCEKTKISLEENPEKIITALKGAIEASEGKDGVKKIFQSDGAIKSLEKLFGAGKWKSLADKIL